MVKVLILEHCLKLGTSNFAVNQIPDRKAVASDTLSQSSVSSAAVSLLDPPPWDRGGRSLPISSLSIYRSSFASKSTLPALFKYECPMAVLIPRARTIGVRLSEEEYSAVEQFCAQNGSRSISDLARKAIYSFMNHAEQERSLALSVGENSAKMEELKQKVEQLSAELALLKTNRTPHSRRSGHQRGAR